MELTPALVLWGVLFLVAAIVLAVILGSVAARLLLDASRPEDPGGSSRTRDG